MLGTNERGEFVVYQDYDPQTGARTLENINKASLTENVVVASEHQIAKQEQARAYDAGLKFTKEEAKAKRRVLDIQKRERDFEIYRDQVYKYQRQALVNQKINERSNQLTVENAILDFKNQPYDKSVLLDSGFKSVRGQGMAHIPPMTDYEKIIQGSETNGDVVAIDHNPLSGQPEGRTMSRGAYESHMAGLQSKSAGGLRLVRDESSYRDEMGFSLDNLWSTAQDTIEAEAEKRLAEEIKKALNPGSVPKTSSQVSVETIQRPPTYIPVQSSGIDQKYLIYGAAALGGIAILGILVSVLKKGK